ncbi:hypothetical protein ACQKWADRAFT_111913 [Trichoderma austrokoningii]
MKEGQKYKTKTQFSTPRLPNLAREQKVPQIPCQFQSLVFHPLRGLVVQSVGIRPSHAAAKNCCNRTVQIFFFFLFPVFFFFSSGSPSLLNQRRNFFSTVEPSLAQFLTMSFSKRMCESSHFQTPWRQ